MDNNLDTVLKYVTGKFTEIKKISHWRTVQSLASIDQINDIIGRRQKMLDDIHEQVPALDIDPATLPEPQKKLHARLKKLVRDIHETDRVMMEKIKGRMTAIREELRASCVTRNTAIPSYTRQKYALSG